MAYITPQSRFAPINISETVRQRVVDKLNVYRQAQVASAGISTAADMVQMAEARIPRIYYTHATPVARVPVIGGTFADGDLCGLVYFHDDRVNHRNVAVTVLHGPMFTDANVPLYYCNVHVGSAANSKEHCSFITARPASYNSYYDHAVVHLTTNLADAASNATHSVRVEGTDYFRPYGVVIADSLIDGLDTSIHAHVNCHVAPGETILDADLESLYDGFYGLRTRGLKQLFSYGGHGYEFSRTGGGIKGANVSSNTYVNLFDGVSTTRTANTPGFSCPVYAAGIGNPDSTAGKRVKVACYVSGICGTAPMSVNIVGPDTFPNNWTVLTVANTRAIAANGGTGYCVYLDSSVNAYENSVNRNKIDVLALSSTGDGIIKSVSGQMITDYEGY